MVVSSPFNPFYMNLGAACNRARPHPEPDGILIYLKVIQSHDENRSLSRVKISVFEIATLGYRSLESHYTLKINNLL
jgi:hypothetical protein